MHALGACTSHVHGQRGQGFDPSKFRCSELLGLLWLLSLSESLGLLTWLAF
jgi:hypothetical protein